MKKFTNILILLFLMASACSYLPDNFTQDSTVNLEENTEYIKLTPTSGTAPNALILVPGGLVDPHAYVSLMQSVAGDGIEVYILKVSANLAILEINKALRIKNSAESAVDNWYIAGHSLGGINAQAAVYRNPGCFKGLILLGTYPYENYDLSDWSGNVLSVYAENDKLSTIEEIETGKAYLPPEVSIENLSEFQTINFEQVVTVYYMIKGGNHSQFGAYGFQEGDGEAEISQTEQHRQISEAILTFIGRDEN
jgi:pimeloyl-ACP methyl ester carboxylesterase